jgi:tight adherence protein C
MRSSPVAPSLAALAASAAVLAARFRGPAVLTDLVTTRDATVRRPLDRVGSIAVVRSATSADRLRSSLEMVGASSTDTRLAGAAAVGAVAVSIVCLGVGHGAVFVAPVLIVAALRAPSFAAGRAARRRLLAIDRDVPLLLDVLALASFAGLPPPSALSRAVSAIDGPLAEELAAALGDIELGARWRDRLTRVADDVPISDLRRAIALLVRTDAIGASTAEPIAILADEVRSTRRVAAGERARKAPVQMLFPLVFLVLPAFLLLTVVPVLVATLGSIQ